MVMLSWSSLSLGSPMSRDLPHVVLVGPMGVGKTSVGEELARLLDRPFLDSDAEIEEMQGRTSGEIAADLGVIALHEVELATFIDLASRSTPSVIAPASSVVDSPVGRDLLGRCLAVRLTASHEETIWRMNQGEHRRDVDEEEVVVLNQRRAPHLEAIARTTVDTTEISIAEAARRVFDRLGGNDRGF